MATVTFGTSYNLVTTPALYDISEDDILSVTSSQVSMRAPNGYTHAYTGYFSLNGQEVDPNSIITGFSEHNGNTLNYSISNATLSAYTYDSLAQSGSAQGVLGYVLRGNDTFTLSNGNDVAYGYEGNDSMTGLYGNDVLNGHYGNDHVQGHAGRDFVRGGAGNDIVRGGADNDTVYGDKGNDTIHGDKGNDMLAGGSGSDTFVFKNGTGIDHITDFEDGTDTIAIYSNTGITSFSQLNIEVNGGSSYVHLDGSNHIIVDGVSSLDAGDFTFI